MARTQNIPLTEELSKFNKKIHSKSFDTYNLKIYIEGL